MWNQGPAGATLVQAAAAGIQSARQSLELLSGDPHVLAIGSGVAEVAEPYAALAEATVEPKGFRKGARP
jgi:hypothetical protein